MSEIIKSICEKNTKSSDKIQSSYDKVKKIQQGNGIIIAGKKVVSLRNTTQNDTDSKTADLVMIFSDLTELGISCTCTTIQKNGDIKKCLSNPSCTRFGCTPDNIKDIELIAEQSKHQYALEMFAKYGQNTGTNWKRKPSIAAKKAASSIIL